MSAPAQVDVTKFQRFPDLVGEDDEDTRLLLTMAEQALNYVSHFKWAQPVEGVYLAHGYGGMFAVFLIRFAEPIVGHPDTEVWIVIGNGPPAYFEVDILPRASDVFDTYCFYMEQWADRVLAGEDLSECYPIAAAPTAEHAKMLKWRVNFIRENLIPDAKEIEGPATP